MTRSFVPYILVLALAACGGGHEPGTEDGPRTLASIERQLVEDPTNASLFAERARHFEALDSSVAAMNDWKRAIALDSTNSAYMIALGDLFFRKVRLAEAEEYLTKAFTVDPSDTEARLKLSEIKLFVREYQRAMALANEALRIDPLLAQGYYLKGWIHMEMGDTALSISSYRTAIEQDPAFHDAFLQLGVLHADRGDELAMAYYNSALEVQPASVGALYGKGMFAQEHGMDSLALDCYARIKEIEPMNPLPWYNTGYILLEHRNHAEAAVAEFSAAIERLPYYPQAYYNRGLSHERKGTLDSALIDYRKALEQEPDMTMAAEGLSRLQRRGVKVVR